MTTEDERRANRSVQHTVIYKSKHDRCSHEGCGHERQYHHMHRFRCYAAPKGANTRCGCESFLEQPIR